MTVMPSLPNEVVSLVLSHVDLLTINQSIAQIPQLKSLMSLRITDCQKTISEAGNVVTVQEIINRDLSLDSLFKSYHFFQVEITQFQDEQVYMRTHRLLARLLKLKKDIRITYHPRDIDMTYLKMFKSLFNSLLPTPFGLRNPHLLSFPNLRDLRSNANHLLVSHIVEYPSLAAMNLYYCSSKFYFEVFDYLNLQKHPHTFPSLTYLKLEDYMNEEEDLYSKHSNNYIRPEEFEDDYDDYDHNSDLDENEFYFDGLEILQNYNLTKLESLTLKNTNVSRLKNINAPNLHTLKLFELSNKHIEAFDLNLVDSEHIQSHSFLSSSISTSCSVQGNNFPALSTLKIIGHINLKELSGNRMRFAQLKNVVVKGTNVEIDDKDSFWRQYSEKNELMVKF